MKKRKIIRHFSVLIIIFSFILTPLKFETFISRDLWARENPIQTISENTTWRKGEDIILDHDIYIQDGATLTIEKGATIKFSQRLFSSPRFLKVRNGRIVAEGTKEEKIRFMADHPDSPPYDKYGIMIDDSGNNGPSFFRYVEFINGGYYPYYLYNDQKSLLNTAYALDLSGAFEYYKGKVHIENSTFENSYQGAVYASVYESGYNPDGHYLEIVNSNFGQSGSGVALLSKIYSGSNNPAKTKIKLKNNYYNNKLGPTFAEKIPVIPLGESLYGKYEFSGFRSSDMIADPAVVIPGITGSMPSKLLAGKLVLDPILHIYDNLMASLERNGYEKNKNLFDFPYEWRNSNIVTADELKTKIKNIRDDTGVSKVDLVAHSMGGLLARQYIEGFGYQNDVDELVALGTPHRGSPKAYIKWEAGEGLEDFFDSASNAIFKLEAYHNGYSNLRDYIQSEVISVKELLPDYNYLQENGEMKGYPDDYPENTLLKDLNSQSWVNNLDRVNFYNIFGNTNSEKTIKKFRVADSTVPGSWEHGMPENFYSYETDRGIEYGSGDETVPLSSADGILANKKKEIESSHSDLPTKAQCYVFKELTGKTDCQYVNTFDRVKNILTFGVFSPVDIQVVAPSGQWAGKNINNLDINNQITGSYYSGYDFGGGPDNEFLTIPISENSTGDGEYTIVTQGTDNGTYKIEVAKVSEDENNLGVGSTAVISGTATTGVKDELAVEVAGNEIISNQDKAPPTVKITSPENRTYQNNQVLEIKYDVSDNVSVMDKIKTEVFYDGVVVSVNEIDLSLEHLGAHSITVKAMDEAGNAGEEKIEFTNDTNVDSIISNINHYFDLHLITSIGTKNYFRAKLQIIQSELQGIDELKKSKLPKFAKDKLLIVFQKIVNLEISQLINQIQKEKNLAKTIDSKVSGLLIESLQDIKL